MDKKQYEFLKEQNPKLAKIWKSAVEDFPDEGLRKYFTDWDNFVKFYYDMVFAYHDEEVRFWNMFKICPYLKQHAVFDTEDFDEAAIDAWSLKAGWN